jgi:ribonuclease D
MKTIVHKFDLPKDFKATTLSIDTETMGLNLNRDRLCCVQLLVDEQEVHIVHFPKPIYNKSPNLISLLKDKKIFKLFHFARFDMLAIYKYLGVLVRNVACTRILSKITRTFSDRHSLKELCREKLKVDISKNEQSSDWGRNDLTQGQIDYAAKDVIYLPGIFKALKETTERENRFHVAQAIFDALPSIIIAEANFFDPIALIEH